MSIILIKNKHGVILGETTVSDSDFTRLSQFRWEFITDTRGRKYVMRRETRDGKRVTLRMHREILGLALFEETQVDHIDNNPLNNQRSNLRKCSLSENHRNRSMARNNSTGLKGVYFHKRDKCWTSCIGVNGKQIWLGKFKKKTDARNAYVAAAKKYHGEFANVG